MSDIIININIFFILTDMNNDKTLNMFQYNKIITFFILVAI